MGRPGARTSPYEARSFLTHLPASGAHAAVAAVHPPAATLHAGAQQRGGPDARRQPVPGTHRKNRPSANRLVWSRPIRRSASNDRELESAPIQAPTIRYTSQGQHRKQRRRHVVLDGRSPELGRRRQRQPEPGRQRMGRRSTRARQQPQWRRRNGRHRAGAQPGVAAELSAAPGADPAPEPGRPGRAAFLDRVAQ